MTRQSLQHIARTLNEAGVRYLVVGGLAVNAHGYLRLTLDVDLLIDLAPDNIITALNALSTLGYRPHVPITAEQFANAHNRERWIAEKGMKVLKLHSDAHRETVIDVFVSDPLGFGQAYSRAKLELLGDGVSLTVCSYEDLVRLRVPIKMASKPRKLLMSGRSEGILLGTLKLEASRPKDLLDLEQLKKARGE